MNEAFSAALAGQPWAVGELLFGLDGLHDDEGRPLGERRAPSAAKKSVPMELKPCPYSDERHGQMMNASALEQVNRHWKAALEDIAAFHALIPAEIQGWRRMLLAVTDQLVRPAMGLLESRDPRALLPAASAVGYKLAAGYFGVMRRVLVEEARGAAPMPSVAGFVEFVRRERALLGGNEVCAGAPKQIEKTTEVFLLGAPEHPRRADPRRYQVAHALCAQIGVGVAWELFDGEVEEELLLDIGAGRMRARTKFVDDALLARRASLGAASRRAAALDAVRALPPDLEPELRQSLLGALQAGADRNGRGAVGMEASEESEAHDGSALDVERLLHLREGALELDERSWPPFARSFRRWLEGHRSFVAATWRLERELRGRLGYDVDVPVKICPLAMPRPRSLQWFEALLGHALQSEPGERPCVRLRNRHRTIDL